MTTERIPELVGAIILSAVRTHYRLGHQADEAAFQEAITDDLRRWQGLRVQAAVTYYCSDDSAASYRINLVVEGVVAVAIGGWPETPDGRHQCLSALCSYAHVVGLEYALYMGLGGPQLVVAEVPDIPTPQYLPPGWLPPGWLPPGFAAQAVTRTL
jgi:hypothetical protein